VPTFARRRSGIFVVVPKDAAGPDVRRGWTAGGTLNRSAPHEKRPPLFHLQPVSHPVVDPVPGEQVLTTPPATDMALPLEVLADLQLAVDGEDIDIRGTGDRIVVDLSSLRAGRRLLASGPFASAQRARTTGRVHEALDIAGLTVEVRLRGDPVARLGAEAQPGTIGRLLNLDGIEVRPTQPLRAVLRRRPVLTAAVVIGLVAGLGWWLFRRGDM
jgi:hypothetical protein